MTSKTISIAASQRTETTVQEIAYRLLDTRKNGKGAWVYIGASEGPRQDTQSPVGVGAMHLTQVALQGFFSIILTSREDNAIERALYASLSPEKIRIFSVSTTGPKELARAIESAQPGTITVIRLDLNRKGLKDLGNLMELIVPEQINNDIVLASLAEVDDMAARCLIGKATGRVYSIAKEHLGNTTDTKAQYYSIAENQPSAIIPGGTITVTCAEDFFTALNLQIQKNYADQNENRLREIEASILTQHESDKVRIGHGAIGQMTREISNKILELTPDAVFVIHDPALPVGVEIYRQLHPILKEADIDIRQLHLANNPLSIQAAFKREDILAKNYSNILILDAVTFSGDTLKAAKSLMKEIQPLANVHVAALMASRQVSQKLPDIIHQTVTDNLEIIFPWGVARTRSQVSRYFKRLDNGDRTVDLYSRPWGTIEILADQEPCSVRILTLHANRRLSFQRHLCRDEFFLALDDDICVELYSGKVKPDASLVEHGISSMLIKKGEYVLVPRGMWHRTKSTSKDCRLLEVAFGPYDQVLDIERRWDDYNRSKQDGSK